MNESFSVGTSAGLTAFHRMPVQGPEGELHSHDYRIDVEVETSVLDEHSMVVNLDTLMNSLRSIVDALEGTDLEAIKPKDAEAVTVEVLAQHIHSELTGEVSFGAGSSVQVRVWESETEFGGYRSTV